MKTFLAAILAIVAFTVAQAQSAPTLVWTPNPAGDQVTGYNVYEKVGATFNLLTPAPITVTSYSLSGAPAGAHTYAITAVNIRGESGKSAEVILPVAPTMPTGLKINP